MTVDGKKGGGTDFTYSGEELDSLGEARNYYAWISSRFAPWLGPRIVEVGAGIGTFLSHLLALRPDARVTAVHGYLDGSLPAGEADAVVAVNVVEHVEDDAAVLRAAARALAPGGHLLLFVPALPALFGTLDEAFDHYRRYTRRELLEKLAAAGLEPVEARYMNVTGIAAWWLWSKVLRRRTITAGDARTYDRWVVPVVRWLEDRIDPPVGNALLAVARKTVENEG